MPQHDYTLKPDVLNIFQKLYDKIDEYDNPALRKQLSELWKLLVKTVEENGEEVLKQIIAIIKAYLLTLPK